MKCQIVENNTEHWATNLRRERGSNNLIWDHAPGQAVLIIQTPYEKTAVEMLEGICRDLENREIVGIKYVELSNGVWLRSVPVRDRSCPIHEEASTYTVLAYTLEKDVLSIYTPNPKGSTMISPYHKVPLNFPVKLERMIKVVKRGFLFKKTEEVYSDFWKITFPSDKAMNYADNTIYYMIGEFCVPVTRKIIEAGYAYVRSGEIKPIIKSRSKGIELMIEE